MPFYETQITIYPVSNLNADASTNTWSCEADDITAYNDFYTNLIAFYQAVRPYFSNLTRQSNHLVKAYNRADPEPRAPVANNTWSFTSAPSGSPFPTEVAMCLSFQGDQVSGTSQARRRGRVYLGPLATSTGDTTGRPAPAFRNALIAAADDLLTASSTATTWTWTVHSTVLGTDAPVTNGWCDDEWDTQRRRGRLPTVRQTFP